MEGLGLFSKLILILSLAKIFRCSRANSIFYRMTDKSSISITKINAIVNYHPEFLLEISGNVAIYKSKKNETIKVLYPLQNDRKALFQNEMIYLNRLNQAFRNNSRELSVENGIAQLIDCGRATWKHEDDANNLIGDCLAIVYTYGEPLFPILQRLVWSNDQRNLFWYFSQMAKSMTSILKVGKTYHNNIGPNVFRLTTNGTVFVDNFEVARPIFSNSKDIPYLKKNGFPIGFKPTMHRTALNGGKRLKREQMHSFELTSYYILYDKLPWDMNAIDFLWNFNMTEARQITFELQEIKLENYYKSRGTWNPTFSKILTIIDTYGYDYKGTAEHFRGLYDAFISNSNNELLKA